MTPAREKDMLELIARLEESIRLHEEQTRLNSELVALQAEQIRRLQDENSRYQSENQLLRQKLDLILRKLFDKKNESLDPAQLELLLDPEAAKKASAADPADPGPAADTATASNNRAPRRPRDLSRLEVREVLLIPEPVKACPDAWREIDRVETDRLDYQPAAVFIERLVRPVFVRRADPDAVPFKSPAPPSMRPGLSATPRLIAHVMVAKFRDHLPFYRQSTIWQSRHGIELPRHTLCRWADITADTLEPLYKLTHQHLLQAGVLQADESPVRYLDPGRDKCATGYYWGLHAPQCGAKGDILFQWHPSRRSACLDALLPGHTGILQTDGYAAYDSWSAKNPGVTGQRGAILHTLLENAVRHGHNPEAWLADVLERLPAMTNRDDLEILLPSRWQNPVATRAPLATCD